MPIDELSHAQMLDIATTDAVAAGMATQAHETDETLRLTIRPIAGGDEGTRNTVTLCTSGTGAFLVDFDDEWSWQVFAYDRGDQTEAIRDIVKAADRYFQNLGQPRTTKQLFGRTKRILEIKLDDDLIVLREKRR